MSQSTTWPVRIACSREFLLVDRWLNLALYRWDASSLNLRSLELAVRRHLLKTRRVLDSMVANQVLGPI